ncbi:phosphocholine-specific phospholipase C [Streptomyces sp. NBC_01465]|uniref:phosphocholine-specific phospholipase C n=1 Tax=Streptomyces sp. NBC_01465 TaxID=2903878 RepID=UPI002E34DB69|nr:phospholipase C, phosphocholine-specific [Streptomyces sp. NBC_01465]
MAPLDRRRLLQLGGVSAVAAAGLDALPGAIGQAMALPAISRHRSIKDVEHVVILMQENRSFDHYFGTLRGVRGFGDPRPALLPNGKPVWHQPAATTKVPGRFNARGLPDSESEVLPWYIDPRATTEYTDGTDHGWASGHQAWREGRWDSWVTQKQDVLTMGHLKRQDLAYHFALAESFTLCDSYFCSVHADTAPNRLYLWSGTMDPRNALGRKPNGPGTDERNDTNGYTWTTYAERLEAAGVSWKLYQGGTGDPGSPTDNFTDNSLMFFENFQPAMGASGPLVDKGASNHTLREFAADVKAGTLPQVTWIVPPYKYSEHPSASPTDGAFYINRVIESLTANPEVWGRTVLIVNYDENDGLFDHVVPPVPPISSAPGSAGMVSDDLLASLPDEMLDMTSRPGWKSPAGTTGPGGPQPVGLGPRVPAMVISPWSRGGWVCSETFDHSSVVRFLEARFGVREPNISAWRRSVCGDLTSALDFRSTDPAPPVFQVPAPVVSAHKPYQVPLPQTMPAQEPGVRRARPLPYDVTVNEHPGRKGRFELALANRGRAGAAFAVHDRTQPDAAPRRYTVSAHDTLTDHWELPAGGAYHLAAYGPNGGLFEFEGDGVGGLRATAAHHRSGGSVSVRVTNHDRRATHTVRLTDAYGSTGAKQHRLRPGASFTVEVPVHRRDGWYDITVTAEDAGAFRRRWAGHLENGRPSTTDPGPRG